MITTTERDYLKESLEKDLVKIQKAIAKLTNEINDNTNILQKKRDEKDSLIVKQNELLQMKQHVESVVL